MYSVHLSRIFFSFFIMMSPFFHFKHPVNELVFFPKISSMFLYIVYSVLPWYRSMFPRLSLIHFSLASSHFFMIFLFNVHIFLYYFPLLPDFHDFQNIPIHPLLFCLPFNSWDLFHCCVCDCYFELYPLLVHFLSFS